MAPMKYVGADACTYGWFGVGLDQNGYDFGIFREFAELLGHYRNAELILVDIPIGLPEGKEGRDCDGEAWGKLGFPRSSSVFPTPTRQTVEYVAQQVAEQQGYTDGAAEVEREHSGKGVSPFSLGILPKIAQVDTALLCLYRRRSRTPRVREVHPELLFWALNDENPMTFKKKEVQGENERLQVLTNVEPRSQDISNEACREFLGRTFIRNRRRKNAVEKDDILDSLAAAVTAFHGLRLHQLRTLPRIPQTDSKGLWMEMVYWMPG